MKIAVFQEIKINSIFQIPNDFTYEDAYTKLYEDVHNQYDIWDHYLSKRGCEVVTFQYNFTQLTNLFLFQNGINLSSNYDQDIVNYLTRFKPDIIWFDINNLHLLKLIKKNCPYTKCVGWLGSAIDKKDCLGHFDLILSCAKENINLLRSQNLKINHVNHGFDTRLLVDTKDLKLYDFSFIGQLIQHSEFHSTRVELINSLLLNANLSLFSDTPPLISEIINSKKYKVFRNYFELLYKTKYNFILKLISDQLFGSEVTSNSFYYTSYFVKSKKRIYKGVYGKLMYETISQSKIVLNVHADSSPIYASNMRLFEVTGMGSCLITDKKKNNSSLFEVDNEILEYASKDELIEKVNYLLNNVTARKEIELNGQRKTLSNYTMDHRFDNIENEFKNEISK